MSINTLIICVLSFLVSQTTYPKVYVESDYYGQAIVAFCLANDSSILIQESNEGMKSKVKESGSWTLSNGLYSLTINNQATMYKERVFENLSFLVPIDYKTWDSTSSELIKAYAENSDYKEFKEIHLSDPSLMVDRILQEIEYDISKQELSGLGILIDVPERRLSTDYFSKFYKYLKNK